MRSSVTVLQASDAMSSSGASRPHLLLVWSLEESAILLKRGKNSVTAHQDRDAMNSSTVSLHPLPLVETQRDAVHPKTLTRNSDIAHKVSDVTSSNGVFPQALSHPSKTTLQLRVESAMVVRVENALRERDAMSSVFASTALLTALLILTHSQFQFRVESAMVAKAVSALKERDAMNSVSVLTAPLTAQKRSLDAQPTTIADLTRFAMNSTFVSPVRDTPSIDVLPTLTANQTTTAMSSTSALPEHQPNPPPQSRRPSLTRS
jgi:hypothetical protein